MYMNRNMEVQYLISEWKLDSNGTPYLTLSLFTRHENALKKFNEVKTTIIEKSKPIQYILLKLDTIEQTMKFCDEIDEDSFYVVEQSYDTNIAFYQDYGFKRPMGVALQCVEMDENGEWTSGVKCYPNIHGGKW